MDDIPRCARSYIIIKPHRHGKNLLTNNLKESHIAKIELRVSNVR